MSLNKKKRIILTLLIILCIISSIGYVIAFRDLNISGKLIFRDAKWKINFTDIQTIKTVGNAINYEQPKLGPYNINFYAEFVDPGDEIHYRIKIANQGNLDAVVTNMHFIENNVRFLDYEIQGIDIGTVLRKGKDMEVTIKLKYSEKNIDVQNNDYKNIQFIINWDQKLN